MLFRIRVLVLTVALSVCTGGGFGGDVVLPGQKGVTHELAFCNLDAFPNFDFYLLMPEGWDREPIHLKEGEGCSFYKLLTGRLVAVENGVVPAANSIVAAAKTEFGLHTQAKASSPVHRRLSRYRVERVADGVIEFRDLGTVEYDSKGEVLSTGFLANAQSGGPILIAVLAAFGLLFLAGKRYFAAHKAS